MKRILCAILIMVVFITLMSGQTTAIAEILGYDSDTKLLIMHADDLGVAHSVNAASIAAFEDGGISSSSIMVPCPWFTEIAAYAKENPEFCWGLHLTLTSEWKYYKWDGVASSDKISSLLNEEGVMYDKVIDVVSNANIEEVEIEIRAQIEKAIKTGIPVSHLDSHMGTLFATPELFRLYVRMGNEYKLPVMIPGDRIPPSWNIDSLMGPVQYPLDNLVMMGQMAESWQQTYDGMIDKVKPGLNEIIIHLGYDDAEMQAVMVEHPDFGASWRQNDLDYVLSHHYRKKLKDKDIVLVSWKQIRDALLANGN